MSDRLTHCRGVEYTAGACYYSTVAPEPPLLECLYRLPKQNVSRRCTARAHSYTAGALNTLSERPITLPECCGSRAYIVGAFFGTAGACRL
ncbi:hypothetical protein AMTR_s00107p00034350 [Amborella trichopoda]|uniref:Uncharacterized protein n=1 Tax=Amborella trichopoda TaxID=13333 RepID=W1NSZ5_AMBTC|nr:hypothetical protein AMTR_s00107p00034350 [Amborella trichopoda]